MNHAAMLVLIIDNLMPWLFTYTVM